MPPVRRLTAILAADVAGYSRLMGADEEGTHDRLKAHLRELVNPKISRFLGGQRSKLGFSRHMSRSSIVSIRQDTPPIDRSAA
jgi:hypothetical protein